MDCSIGMGYGIILSDCFRTLKGTRGEAYGAKIQESHY